jgi:FixJ family two-component response regulator
MNKGLRTRSSTVIIVDDDDGTRESLKFLLECEGIEVKDFASGTELVAKDWPPAAGCLILDIHMPGLSGLEVLDELRRASDLTPVVMVTGQPYPGLRERALAAGALDVLEKPVNDSRIVDLVRRALEHHRHADRP